MNSDGAVLLHSPGGRTFQLSRREVTNFGFVVTLVEIDDSGSGASPVGTSLPLELRTRNVNGPSGLTARASEVLRLLVRGHSMKEVARRLGITARTVAFHKYKVMEANGLRTNADLLRFAVRCGLLDPVSQKPISPQQVFSEGFC